LLLDAGCGGRGSSISRTPESAEVIGIDLLKRNISASKQHCPKTQYVLGDLTALPFKENTFNGAFCIDVLEHIPQKRQVLCELARTTRKNGFVIGVTSNLLNPIMFLDAHLPLQALAEKYEPGQYERHSRMNPSQLCKVLSEAGFQMNILALVGFPPFSRWIYRHTARKEPWFAYLWISFDKLRRKKPLLFLKENMIWQANKN
jgi:2-polyprenyl-3-methyl-5-hydroxy-6-metoxy-1,4-benzoquinol methylase